jgi:hypothetical protein
VRVTRHLSVGLEVALAVLLAATAAGGQTAQLRGQVTDPTGAIIPGATVSLTAANGRAVTATASGDGTYSFPGLETGDYRLQAAAPNLVMAEPIAVTVRSGLQTVNLQLQVARASQQVSVEENAGPAVATDPASNATALVLRGDDLQALADNPEDLATDLAALAGPSAGPGGGAIFIDGFSGGDLPSKDSIREVRINQNPFAPEYDKLGLGRVEIFTKPGSDQFRGQAYYNLGDDALNSRNPYAAEKAPFLLKEYGGNFGGPLRKRASYLLNIERHAIDNGAIINGSTLDPSTLAIIDPYTAVLRIPQRRIIVSSRLDYRLSDNNTLAARYVFIRAGIEDSGVGSFNLPSRGVHARSTSHTGQVTETAVLGPTVNETRFQFYRLDTSNLANNLIPAIQVLGAFNGGGSIVRDAFNTQNNYELQNYTSVTHAAHSVKFGVRLREQTVDDTSPQNFGGTFTFSGGLAPQLGANNQLVLDASGQPVLIKITSIESYRRTLLFQQAGLTGAQIRALGGGASQFSISGGTPGVSASQFDAAAFAGDDWRARMNLTLSFGVRYEAQTNVHDWRDFAPRVAVAWAPGTKPAKTAAKTVIRAGFGMFYDRFALNNTVTARRYNGLVQQQYVITAPDFFPAIPSLSALASLQTPVTTQRVAPELRAPYLMQSSIGIERQLSRNTTVAVTYANTHGLHELRSAAINAPLPGSGLFPLGTPAPVYQMESSGLYNQSQVITNINTRVSKKVSLFGSYTYNRALSNTDDLGTFPANPYKGDGEYGAAATDIRHRVSTGGSIETWGHVRLSPLLNLNSGPPFDITVGRDLYGDTLFNARPGISTDPNKPGLIATRYGLLDPNPTPGETIVPRNFGRGPGAILFNLRIARAFAFGPVHPPADGKGSGDHRYNLNLSLAIRNLLNHNNPGPIIGNITSPLFGQANQPAGAANLGGTGFSESANNRRLEFQTRFTF